MNGTPLNQPSTAAPLPPAPVHASKVKWLLLAVAVIVIIVGALSFRRRGKESEAPPPPAASPADVEDVLQGFGGLTPGNSPEEIDQDIQNTDLDSLSAELEALEKELEGL